MDMEKLSKENFNSLSSIAKTAESFINK
jgi:hypothetical protein